MEEMGRLQFSDLFTELLVPPLAAGVVEHCIVLYYIILSTTVSVLDLKDAILFLQGLSFFQFFLCTLPFFCKYNRAVCTKDRDAFANGC